MNTPFYSIKILLRFGRYEHPLLFASPPPSIRDNTSVLLSHQPVSYKKCVHWMTGPKLTPWILFLLFVTGNGYTDRNLVPRWLGVGGTCPSRERGYCLFVLAKRVSAIIRNARTKTLFRGIRTRDDYAGWTGGRAVPSALIHGGQEGQELPFILNSFHLSYLLKGHFPASWTVWFIKIF